ncbi:MAG: prephenate dehydratase [Actinomycetota bacterium]|nr:prephenate dehydratase [Actinomycetota bacterium]
MASPNGAARRYAYLGPAGTFTEAAVRTLAEAADAELMPCTTVPAALDAVRAGAASAAVVPLENSVEGSVATTLDELATGELLHIRGEILLPVTFVLMTRPGTALSDVRTVSTHPHAEAQCRQWLRQNLPDAAVELAPSTAAAAAAIADGRSPEGTAAIAAPLAAQRYGLQVLASGLGSAADAVTRFLLVTPPGPPPPATGADRTTVVAYIADDHPGALLELLTEFAVRGVNLTRIESRPTGSGLGRYYFSVDCEGSVAEARVGEALSALRRVCADVRFLGSYPRADYQPTVVRPGTTEEDFAAARDWLDRLRSGTP